MTPADAYTYGLAALDEYTEARFGMQFAELATSEQDEVLELLAASAIDTFKD